MLAISPAASAAISDALQGAELPDGAGLRVTAGPQTEHGTPITITFVAAPDPLDQVVDTDAPADVFVAPAAADLLDDQVLDADVGVDGRINFTLHDQSESAGQR
jgi:Fe-S cluster assembly iron-binding protein IscA